MIGIVGAGNMGTAIARGLGEAIYATDGGSGRAAALVAELGGEALKSNAELVKRSDIIILCHEPHMLDAVAAEVDATGKLVISTLGPTTVAQLQKAFPGAQVVRIHPNLPVELGKGVVCIVEGGEVAKPLFERIARVVIIPESKMQIAVATMGVTTAYIAVIVEAMVDAAALNGLTPKLAGEMFLGTLKGAAELIEHRGGDTLAVRRQVASPGESTVRGLAALERGGLRNIFQEAMRDVLTRLNQPYHA